jgi:hypothetical protein
MRPTEIRHTDAKIRWPDTRRIRPPDFAQLATAQDVLCTTRMDDLLSHFSSAGLWDLPNNIEAHGEDDRLLLQIDGSALTLFSRLSELGSLQEHESRLRAALAARKVCAGMLRQIDTLRTRVTSPHLERASEGLRWIERRVSRELAAV